MKAYQELLLSNKAWAREMRERKEDYFSQQIAGQKPQVLWIGCSDSRVSPEQLLQTRPGELFIHRNIANLVHAEDTNLLSVLQFAVEVLEVPHVVLCGHYACGGIQAAMKGDTQGPIDAWLANARRVEAAHGDELAAITDPDARVNRLVELNVRDQLIALSRTATIAAAFARGQELALHGWVYDLRDGLIKELLEIDRAVDHHEVDLPRSVLQQDAEPAPTSVLPVSAAG